MTELEVIGKAEELKESLRLAQGYPEFYQELLDEYAVQVWALKVAGCSYPWEQLLRIQEEYTIIEAKLPNVSDAEFDEYIHLGNMVAILLTEVKDG